MKKRTYHKHDWTKVDWSKSSITLAQEMGTCRTYVSKKRRQFAPHTSRPVKSAPRNRIRPRTKRDWSQVDWSLGNRELSQQLGLTRGYIFYMRKQHAPESIRRPLASYDSMIWRLSDEEIARRTGTQLTYVRALRRRQMGVRRPPPIDWKRIDWSRSTGELAIDLHVNSCTVSRARRRFAPETLRSTDAAKQPQPIPYKHLVVTGKVMLLQIPPPEKQLTIGASKRRSLERGRMRSERGPSGRGR